VKKYFSRPVLNKLNAYDITYGALWSTRQGD